MHTQRETLMEEQRNRQLWSVQHLQHWITFFRQRREFDLARHDAGLVAPRNKNQAGARAVVGGVGTHPRRRNGAHRLRRRAPAGCAALATTLGSEEDVRVVVLKVFFLDS